MESNINETPKRHIYTVYSGCNGVLLMPTSTVDPEKQCGKKLKQVSK